MSSETPKKLPDASPKWLCTECAWICADDFLKAKNPFDAEDVIVGCPNCRNINTFVQACQAEGCSERAGSGTPGGNGFRYFWSCHRHNPARQTLSNTGGGE